MRDQICKRREWEDAEWECVGVGGWVGKEREIKKIFVNIVDILSSLMLVVIVQIAPIKSVRF